MFQNVLDAYQQNPAINLQPSDILYLIRSPYNSGNDMGILASNLNIPTVLTYAGNPNGFVQGVLGDFCLDTTTSNNAYLCTFAGNQATTVWLLITGSSSSIQINNIPTYTFFGGV